MTTPIKEKRSRAPRTTTPATDPFAQSIDPKSADYMNAVSLLSAYNEVKQIMASIQLRLDEQQHSAFELVRPDYVVCQEREASLTKKLEAIVERNPDWFAKRKSLTMPCGEIKLTESRKLEVVDEELALSLLPHVVGKTSESYVSTKKSLRLEALEALADDLLKKLGIKRVVTINVNIKPATVKISQALAASKVAETKGAKS